MPTDNPSSAEIVQHLPYLRRYARALAGDQRRGDEYVRVCLEVLLQDRDRVSTDRPIRVQLFRLFHDVWFRVGESLPARFRPPTRSPEELIELRMRSLPALERQALLLNALEGFAVADIAWILDVSKSEVEGLLVRARQELARIAATTVLVIEDEPVVALDIAQIVREMGHAVVGTAATQDEAIALAEAKNPGLILADIQLEEGGSGIEAVNRIMQFAKVPVIFVTAFPERLLTGERPEPRFLVTKPFQPDELKVAIAQALYAKNQSQGAGDARLG